MNRPRPRPSLGPLLAFLLAFSLFPISSFGQCDEPLILGWETWEPYQFFDGKELTGFDIELISAIAADIGCELTFQKRPWERLLDELKEGEVHLVAGAFRTQERELYAWISPPYRRDKVDLWVEVDSQHSFSAFEDLAGSGFRVGVTRGYHYGSAFKKFSEDPALSPEQIVEVADTEDLLPMLRRGKVDGFLADRLFYSHYLRENGLQDGVKRHWVTVGEEDTFLLMSRKAMSRDLAEAIASSLSRLRTNGTYDRIQKKYLE